MFTGFVAIFIFPTVKDGIIPCASSDTQPRTYVCEGKENVRMAKSTKSYEERMLEMEKKEQESLEKAKRYAAQKKELLKRKKAEESKKRTHRLCQVGGAVESVLGATIEEEDIADREREVAKRKRHDRGMSR